MDPSVRALRARMGGLATSAKYDAADITAPARRGFMAKFDALVDPHNELAPAERARRAEAARKQYMAGLALKSSLSRKRAREAREAAAEAEAELSRMDPSPDVA